jgi:hypothetical protein
LVVSVIFILKFRFFFFSRCFFGLVWLYSLTPYLLSYWRVFLSLTRLRRLNCAERLAEREGTLLRPPLLGVWSLGHVIGRFFRIFRFWFDGHFDGTIVLRFGLRIVIFGCCSALPVLGLVLVGFCR